MIYQVPKLLDRELEALDTIDKLRGELRFAVAEPRRWLGGLRRLYFAKAVQGSNSIEGYDASLNDVLNVVEDEEPLDATAETVLALQGYRDAMTYVLQLADERDLEIDLNLIKSLHFMMLKYDLSKRPGRWRRGSIFVESEPDHVVVYEGPDVELVNDLMTEVAESLASTDGHALVRAAMAHLNLVMVHPFADGNGRMGRCLQTLVLTHDRILGPVFCSIEEHLGRNTQAYYDVLGAVGQGSWNPERDARPWLRFCLNAHYAQARSLHWRISATEELWSRCEAIAAQEGLPARAVGPMCDAAQGRRLRNATYRHIVKESEGEEISDQSAGLDLRRLVNTGMYEAQGETRGRYYSGSTRLRRVWADVRGTRPKPAQLDLFSTTVKQSLDGAG
jgi:Fic family protein